MHWDSKGNSIKVGDKVMFRGKVYTIKRFLPTKGAGGSSQIEFEEKQHTPEIADEISIDLVTQQTPNNKLFLVLIPNTIPQMPIESKAEVLFDLSKTKSYQGNVDMMVKALKAAHENGHKEARNRFWRHSMN